MSNLRNILESKSIKLNNNKLKKLESHIHRLDDWRADLEYDEDETKDQFVLMVCDLPSNDDFKVEIVSDQYTIKNMYDRNSKVLPVKMTGKNRKDVHSILTNIKISLGETFDDKIKKKKKKKKVKKIYITSPKGRPLIIDDDTEIKLSKLNKHVVYNSYDDMIDSVVELNGISKEKAEDSVVSIYNDYHEGGITIFYNGQYMGESFTPENDDYHKLINKITKGFRSRIKI